MPLLPKQLCSLQAAVCHQRTNQYSAAQELPPILSNLLSRRYTVLSATIHIITGKLIFLFSRSLRTIPSDWLVVSHFMIPWRHIRISSSSSLTKTKTIPSYTLCILDKICLKIYLYAVKVYPRSCSCHQITCKQGDVYVRGEWKIEWSEFGFKLQTRSTMEFCPIVLAVWYVLKIYDSFFSFKEELKVPDRERIWTD